MKVLVKWMLTGKISTLTDPIIAPETTVAEVKGLVQIQFGFLAKNCIVIANKSLVDNEVALKTIGIVDDVTADRIPLTFHVFTGDELESNQLELDDDGEDDDVQEFTHEDFIKASKMLGRPVPIPQDRVEAMKANAPKQRPEFLNKPVGQKTGAGHAPSLTSRVATIFREINYGQRKEGVEKTHALAYPGMADTFDFWDVRLAEKTFDVQKPGDLALELFYFGEFKPVDPTKFAQLAIADMHRAGLRVHGAGPAREAGCMYPLIAVPFSCSDEEAGRFGDTVFENFGNSPTAIKLPEGAPVAPSANPCKPQ